MALFDWTRPVSIASIKAGFDLHQVAIATDPQGGVQITVGSRDGIIYLSQQRGKWRRSLVTTARRGGYDGSAAIAVDENGSLAVAYQRFASWECQLGGCGANDSIGVGLIEHNEDGWDEPEVIGGEYAGQPDVAIHDAVVYLTYVDEEGAVWFEINTFDESSATGVAPTGFEPSLAISGAGSPAVLFTRHEADSSRLVVALRGPDGILELVDGPEFDSYRVPSALASAADGEIVVAAMNQLWSVDSSGWSDMRTVFPPGSGLATGDAAVAGDGLIQVVSSALQSESVAGLWFAAGYRDQPFSLEAIASDPVECCAAAHAQALAVDSVGQPHVVWTTGDDDVTVWYTTGRRP